MTANMLTFAAVFQKNIHWRLYFERANSRHVWLLSRVMWVDSDKDFVVLLLQFSGICWNNDLYNDDGNDDSGCHDNDDNDADGKNLMIIET